MAHHQSRSGCHVDVKALVSNNNHGYLSQSIKGLSYYISRQLGQNT